MRVFRIGRVLPPALSLGVLGAGLFLLAGPADAQADKAPRTLKIAHQYPAAASAEDGDFRDRICKKFAAEVERRTNGALRFEIFADNTLVKPDKQLEALQKGTIDLCVMPLYNILEKVPEMNLTLLPGLVKSYEHGFRWKEAPVGRDLTALLEKNGAIMLTWNWQAGGIASKYLPILEPDNLRDVRIRGPGKAVDLTLAAFRGKVSTLPSSDIAPAFRDGRLEVTAATSATILSGHFENYCKAVTSPRHRALFYFLIPLVMSKATYDSLTVEQRRIVMEAGASLDEYARNAAQGDDLALERIFLEHGAQVVELSEENWALWQRVARAVSWKEFERSVPNGAEWIRKAQAVE
jgi:TRAP-type C4-dicarboxylate transport system substrate-binding protein